MSNWLELVEQNLAAERPFAVATGLPNGGTGNGKLIIYPDGSYEGEFRPAQLVPQVVAGAQELLNEERSATLTFGDLQVFIEVFAPPPRLLIVGGVHTAVPLAQFAKILGFRVTIIDGRGRFATRERFPEVDEILVAWPDEALPRLGIDRSTYVVILTHDPKFDLPALTALSRCGARYIGAMGSRETRRQHMEQLRAQGVPDEFLKSVYGPVGLDLGARTPEEVALAIIAEIVAVRNGHKGGHLKDKG